MSCLLLPFLLACSPSDAPQPSPASVVLAATPQASDALVAATASLQEAETTLRRMDSAALHDLRVTVDRLSRNSAGRRAELAAAPVLLAALERVDLDALPAEQRAQVEEVLRGVEAYVAVTALLVPHGLAEPLPGDALFGHLDDLASPDFGSEERLALYEALTDEQRAWIEEGNVALQRALGPDSLFFEERQRWFEALSALNGDASLSEAARLLEQQQSDGC